MSWGSSQLGLGELHTENPASGSTILFFHAKMSWQSIECLSRHVREKEKKQKCQCAHDARRQVRGSTNQYDSSSSDHVCTNFKAIHPIAVQRSESGPKLWNETRINIVLEQCPPPPSWPEKFCHIPNSETSAVQAAGLLTLKPTDVRVRSPTIKNKYSCRRARPRCSSSLDPHKKPLPGRKYKMEPAWNHSITTSWTGERLRESERD